MSEKPKVRIVVDEDAAIVARLDEIAEREAISRSDVLRRAIRLLVLSVPSVPVFGNITEVKDEVAA